MYSLLSLPMLLSFSVAAGDSVNVWQLRTLPDALRPAPSRLPPCVAFLSITNPKPLVRNTHSSAPHRECRAYSYDATPKNEPPLETSAPSLTWRQA